MKLKEWSDDVDEVAKDFANNHAKFRDWSWEGRPEDAERYGLLYTLNRDSDLLDQSNHAYIERKLAPFTGNIDDGEDSKPVEIQRHGHWAVGWVEGFVIEVFDSEGKITDAFRAVHKISVKLQAYSILDEDDLTTREEEALHESVRQRVHRYLTDEQIAKSDWTDDDGTVHPGTEHTAASTIVHWLWEHEENECETSDGQGAWPSDESLQRAAWSTLAKPTVKLDNLDDRDGCVLVTVSGENALAWAQWDQSIAGAHWEGSDGDDFALAMPVDHVGLVAELEAEGYILDTTEYSPPDEKDSGKESETP